MFKKIKAGVINMVKQIAENESRIVEAKCDLTKYYIDKTIYCIEKIFVNKETRAVAGMVIAGLGVSLIVSAYIKLPQ